MNVVLARAFALLLGILGVCGTVYSTPTGGNGQQPMAPYPSLRDPLAWLEQRVAASDSANGAQFGTSVAIDGTLAVIGAPNAPVGENFQQGAAYVFRNLNGVWTEVARLVASDGSSGDAFGQTVAVSGNTVAVGAFRAVVNGGAQQGAVYVFTGADGNWSEARKLAVYDPAGGATFGSSLALDGDTLLIGAMNAIVDGRPTGAAYVFKESAGSWSQTAKLTPHDFPAKGEFGYAFGYSVALDGATALIGAQSAAVDGHAFQGAAYVFRRSVDSWNEIRKLTPGDGVGGENFGYSVALDGQTAFVGALAADVDGHSHQGAAYVFDGTGDLWNQVQKIVAADGTDNGFFGASVAVAGDWAFVGGFGTPVGGRPFQGAVHAFARSDGTWQPTERLVGSDGMAGDDYGWSLAFDGTAVLVGAAAASRDGLFYNGLGYFLVRNTGLPTVAAAFAPAAIRIGGSSLATLTLTNPGKVDATLTAPLVDTLPAGLSVSSASTTCGIVIGRSAVGITAATITLPAGTVLRAGSSCEMNAVVTSATAGTYVNRIHAGDLQTDRGDNAYDASATLTVTDPAFDPVAVVTPAALNFAVAAGASATSPLTIGNVGGGDLSFSVAKNRPVQEPPSYRNTQGRQRFDPGARLASRRALGGGLGSGRPVVLDDTTISQMADNSPGDHGVSCGAPDSTNDNSWWRRFYFNEHPQVAGTTANVVGVTISSGSTGPSGLPVTVNLYTIPHAAPADTIPTSALHLIGSGSGRIDSGLVSVTIPVAGRVNDTAAKDLVVEYHVDGTSDGRFFPGANDTAETHPTFLTSAACGVTEPTPAASIGQGYPDFHLTMVIHLGEDAPGDCHYPDDVPWLSAAPASGTLAPGAHTDVAVTADARGLGAGAHAATLCLTTNDPIRPLIAVPVSLTVGSGLADGIYCSGFEGQESGACGASPFGASARR